MHKKQNRRGRKRYLLRRRGRRRNLLPSAPEKEEETLSMLPLTIQEGETLEGEDRATGKGKGEEETSEKKIDAEEGGGDTRRGRSGDWEGERGDRRRREEGELQMGVGWELGMRVAAANGAEKWEGGGDARGNWRQSGASNEMGKAEEKWERGREGNAGEKEGNAG
ncbi:hypothetical protein ACLOJK_005472 [Asimina triloba]